MLMKEAVNVSSKDGEHREMVNRKIFCVFRVFIFLFLFNTACDGSSNEAVLCHACIAKELMVLRSFVSCKLFKRTRGIPGPI